MTEDTNNNNKRISRGRAIPPRTKSGSCDRVSVLQRRSMLTQKLPGEAATTNTTTTSTKKAVVERTPNANAGRRLPARTKSGSCDAVNVIQRKSMLTQNLPADSTPLKQWGYMGGDNRRGRKKNTNEKKQANKPNNIRASANARMENISNEQLVTEKDQPKLRNTHRLSLAEYNQKFGGNKEKVPTELSIHKKHLSEAVQSNALFQQASNAAGKENKASVSIQKRRVSDAVQRNPFVAGSAFARSNTVVKIVERKAGSNPLMRGGKTIPNQKLPSIQDSNEVVQERVTLEEQESMALTADTTANDFLAGRSKQTFEDVYELGPLLGEGAFGHVHSCTHKETKAQRAVKILERGRMEEWEYQEVIEEFQMLTQMDNPNVIRVYEFYDNDDTFYMVQELAQGGELFDELEKHGKLAETDVALLMKNILGCVQYLAEKRIVHRDINLENVLLEEAGNYHKLKLIDFGLAKTCPEGEKLFDLVGKPHYLAPEVLGDDGYGLGYDVWSCGILAAVLLTGYFPIDSDHNEQEIYQQIDAGAYINYDNKDWDGVSGAAKDFVKHLLTYKDEARPTAKEALSHQWITGSTDDSLPTTGEIWTAPHVPIMVTPVVKLVVANPIEEVSETDGMAPPPIPSLVTTPTGSSQDFTSGREIKFEDLYELGKKLGEGAFGEVHVCIHKETRNERAVKILQKNQMDAWEYDDVLQEFQMLTQIENPNVIRVYEFYDNEDSFYIVQELAQGGELYDELEKHGKLAEKDVALLMKNILGCVQYLAEKRIVHRDINLENVLLAAPGNYQSPKLIDFGLAKTCQEGEKLYELVGKPRYLAPEVLGNDGYGLAYDVWSCGILTAILLTGYFPIDSDSDGDVYQQIVDGAYINYDGQDWEGVSKEAKDFVKQLLSYNEDMRPKAGVALAHSWITGNTSESDASAEVWVAPQLQETLPMQSGEPPLVAPAATAKEEPEEQSTRKEKEKRKSFLDSSSDESSSDSDDDDSSSDDSSSRSFSRTKNDSKETMDESKGSKQVRVSIWSVPDKELQMLKAQRQLPKNPKRGGSKATKGKASTKRK